MIPPSDVVQGIGNDRVEKQSTQLGDLYSQLVKGNNEILLLLICPCVALIAGLVVFLVNGVLGNRGKLLGRQNLKRLYDFPFHWVFQTYELWRHQSCRILRATWALFCVILFATYGALMTCNAAAPMESPVISSLEDLLTHPEIAIGISPASSKMITILSRAKPETTKAQIWEKLVRLNQSDGRTFSLDKAYHLRRVLKGNYAYISGFQKSLLPSYVDADFSDVRFFDVIHEQVHMAIPQNVFYKAEIERALMLATESGTIKAVYDKWFSPEGSLEKSEVKDPTVIHLARLKLLFSMAACGIGLAFLSLLSGHPSRQWNDGRSRTCDRRILQISGWLRYPLCQQLSERELEACRVLHGNAGSALSEFGAYSRERKQCLSNSSGLNFSQIDPDPDSTTLFHSLHRMQKWANLFLELCRHLASTSIGKYAAIDLLTSPNQTHQPTLNHSILSDHNIRKNAASFLSTQKSVIACSSPRIDRNAFLVTEGGKTSWTGFSVEILNLLSKALGFTSLPFAVTDGGFYGMYEADGDALGLVGYLSRREAGLTTMAMSTSARRRQEVDFLYPSVKAIQKDVIYNKALGFTSLPFAVTDGGFYGLYEADGDALGLVGYLSRREAGLTSMAMSTSARRRQEVDFLYPSVKAIQKSVIYKVEKQRAQLGDHSQLANSNSQKLFLLIGPCTALIAGLVVFLVNGVLVNRGKVLGRQNLKRLYDFPFHWVFQTTELWRHQSCRILRATWALLCVVLFATYGALMTSHAAAPVERPVISSVKDLLAHPEIAIGIFPSSSKTITTLSRAKPETTKAQFWEKLVRLNQSDERSFSPDKAYHIRRVLKGNYAFIGILRNGLLPSYVNADFRDIRFFDLMNEYMHMAIPQNVFYKAEIERALLLATESGTINTLCHKWFPHNTGLEKS
ncbi:glutamate receptor ionotropic, delta-2 [Plakobranchus ocellatus]|uniref:Glutamate receptor ionotropic, delta-2 n=1 Tax=Plakobranchus ocellatus TaxID=259542 RepID=A0AAV4BQA1_9GAST|nr:glutamate receptor ionotropic, delta-2 [Plakobranchus ocellatus]